MESRFENDLGQPGQELYIEVCKLGRRVRAGVPNTHTRVRESSPSCPRDVLKPNKQAILARDRGTGVQMDKIKVLI
ncbi:hypothetical protein K9O30_02655 [Clostridium bowmanii]|uniref:hypothetical protein n=1 Tax=Clostridium bowmanii TaxID=132925 RepID=UPI001C0BFF8F|nr:hypothetical protein [Clostridium bowmanii]MBU3188272.1 hypothetical protein [Clostridium bowmanii]MCA1072659.1 hypothetical protein [Clostridium bowmanii]